MEIGMSIKSHDLNKIFRVPYTTGPHFEIYDGPLFDRTHTDMDRFTQGERECMLHGSKLIYEDDPEDTIDAVQALGITEKELPFYRVSDKTPFINKLNYYTNNDIAIMKDGRLNNHCILFPTNWIPGNNIGKTFAEIHCPVPGDDIKKAGDKIVKKLSGDRNYHRYAWTLTTSPYLSAYPTYQKNSPFDSAIFIRIEHQKTFPIKFWDDKSGFGFLIDVILYQINQNNWFPDHIRNKMLSSLKTMTNEVIEYKGLEKYRQCLLD